MEALKQEIQNILDTLDASVSFEKLMEQFCTALKNNPEALGSLAGRYRLTAVDTGAHVAFALSENGFQALDASEAADATISGKEADLLKIIRRELNPMTAMFTGKLTVKGSMQALMKFAQIL